MNGYVPVIACLGINNDGQVFNINADTLATQIALALKTNKLVFITDVLGVSEQGNSYPMKTLKIDKATRMIKNGTIIKGMIPKIENIKSAVENGIKNILIVGGLNKTTKWVNAIEHNSYGTIII